MGTAHLIRFGIDYEENKTFLALLVKANIQQLLTMKADINKELNKRKRGVV